MNQTTYTRKDQTMHKAFEEFEEIIQFCNAQLSKARTANYNDEIRTVEQHFREIYNKLYKTIPPQNAEPNENL